MKRKRSRVSGLGDFASIATDAVLPLAGGYMLGEVLGKQLTFLSTNATTGAIVKIAAGLFMASSMKGMVGQLGVGLAANGAVGVVLPALKSAGIARLYPPGVPSSLMAGMPPEFESAGPVQIKMQ